MLLKASEKCQVLLFGFWEKGAPEEILTLRSCTTLSVISFNSKIP